MSINQLFDEKKKVILNQIKKRRKEVISEIAFSNVFREKHKSLFDFCSGDLWKYQMLIKE